MKFRQPFRFLGVFVFATIVLIISVGNDGSNSTALVYVIVPLWLAIADATGYAARKKGRNYWAFFILNFLFPVIIWLVVAAMKPLETPSGNKSEKNTRLCHFCSEEIKVSAIVCKHCNRDV